jgi:hypothetical protein
VTIAELEQRLVAVERELAELKQRVANPELSKAWMATFGAFRDDPLFDEAVRLGREWREVVNRETMP